MRTSAPWAATTAAVALAASLVGCGSEDVARPAAETPHAVAHPTASLPPVEVETGVVHVHGLGVDPADGVLHAATHSGLFRLDPDQGLARRVANRAQDVMGFAVVGPSTFIGSGHPDFREDDVRPPLLGPIESTDAGLTRKRLSLHGKADFHALAVAHGLVYGYDSTSGTFMVSADQPSWDRRSRLPIRDFAVDPASQDVVVATTPQGPVRSADGGRTWTRLGSTGEAPEAMTVDTRGGTASVYVAVTGRGIVVSRDGGRTFAVRYAE